MVTSNSTNQPSRQELVQQFVQDVQGVFQRYYASPGSEQSCPLRMQYADLALYYGSLPGPQAKKSSRQLSRMEDQAPPIILYPHAEMKHVAENGPKRCQPGSGAFLFQLKSAVGQHGFKHIQDAISRDRTHLISEVIEELQKKAENVTLMFEPTGRPCGESSLGNGTVLLFIKGDVNISIQTKPAQIIYPTGNQYLSVFSANANDGVTMCHYRNIEGPAMNNAESLVTYTYEAPPEIEDEKDANNINSATNAPETTVASISSPLPSGKNDAVTLDNNDA